MDALRERLHRTGTKKGCDQGHSGGAQPPTFGLTMALIEALKPDLQFE